MSYIASFNFRSFACLLLVQLLLVNAFSQAQFTQTVRGTVLDADTRQPLAGAAIMVDGLEPFKATTSNHQGLFRFEQIPVGRYNFIISYLGYETYIMSEILVGSGKEVVLNINLKESPLAMNEVVVKANTSKDKPVNSMATLSARTFSVEETSRYAGGMDDPARLASAFAGVTTTQTTSNAIIIRGNSPRGLLWRFEGVDIPAAFHFPNVDFIGGGGFTVLSNQMLRNSDFYTGAFPAEYGNATSGVFDVKMRSGNAQKREFTAGISLIGTDFSAEGPFLKGQNATYLFNYRYSTLGIVGPMMGFPNLPTFQDLSFKLLFPTERVGVFSFWGLGASDKNIKTEERDSTKWENDISRMNQNYYNHFGAMGFSHSISLGTNGFLHSTLSADAMGFALDKKELTSGLELLPTDFIESTEGKVSFRSTLNHRFGPKLTSRTGLTLNSLFYNNLLKKAFRDKPEELLSFVNSQGEGFSAQAFSQFKMSISPSLTANLGIHTMYLNINKKASFEPRAGLQWSFTQQDEISIAYGLHSQMEELRTYFSQANINGLATTPNKNLDFMKSHHLVLGYSRKINEVVRLKIEPYYQFLDNIAVYENSPFAVINIISDWAINNKLSSTGTGRNYGIDITLERFLKDGYYYLFTASVFDSKYIGGDGKEYSTRFNRNHVVNLLAGKEWMIRNKNVLSLSAKFTYMGGLRYTPALYNQSIEAQVYMPDMSQSFAKRFPSSSGLDFTVSYRVNKAHFSGIWYIMMKNALLQPDYSDPFYDFITGDVIIDQMKMPIPCLGYKIEF